MNDFNPIVRRLHPNTLATASYADTHLAQPTTIPADSVTSRCLDASRNFGVALFQLTFEILLGEAAKRLGAWHRENYDPRDWVEIGYAFLAVFHDLVKNVVLFHDRYHHYVFLLFSSRRIMSNTETAQMLISCTSIANETKIPSYDQHD